MKHKYIALAGAVLTCLMFLTGAASARDQIRIVGSSTVFPFATAVAEKFGQEGAFKTPVVEATGSGGGLKLFCSGVGLKYPDITNASRRIKKKEFDQCKANGVTPIEVKIGYDGIVIANTMNGPKLALTKKYIFLALAKFVPDPKAPESGKLVKNPYMTWSDIDPSLPNKKIEVLGPPPTSGTRDAFSELALEGGAKTFAWLKTLRGATAGTDEYTKSVANLDKAFYMVDGKEITKGKKLFKKISHSVREDGAYIEAGENDNLIVQKLESNPDALGIFGFSFLDQNGDKVKGATIDGAAPTFENIASGAYGISRSLFFYVKKEHVGTVPGIKDFLATFTADDTWGEDGYLVDKGLIPMPDEEREKFLKNAEDLTPLDM